MDESVYNNVIDALVDEFGKDVVLSKRVQLYFDPARPQEDIQHLEQASLWQ